jgi:hypothetical protein
MFCKSEFDIELEQVQFSTDTHCGSNVNVMHLSLLAQWIRTEDTSRHMEKPWALCKRAPPFWWRRKAAGSKQSVSDTFAEAFRSRSLASIFNLSSTITTIAIEKLRQATFAIYEMKISIKTTKNCIIWASHRGADEDSRLLGYDTICIGI